MSNQTQTLIREQNGEEQIWYSEDYIKQQMELAYYSGLAEGARIQIFSFAVPMSLNTVNEYTQIFFDKINEIHRQKISEGMVWRDAPKQIKPYL